MKVSTTILLVTLVLLVTAMFASNVILKKEYDKIDKSDLVLDVWQNTGTAF